MIVNLLNPNSNNTELMFVMHLFKEFTKHYKINLSEYGPAELISSSAVLKKFVAWLNDNKGINAKYTEIETYAKCIEICDQDAMFGLLKTGAQKIQWE